MKEVKNGVKVIKSVADQVNSLTEEVSSLNNEIRTLRKSDAEFIRLNQEQACQIIDLQNKFNNFENEAKRNNVIIRGLKVNVISNFEEQRKECETVVAKLFTETLKIERSIDVEKCYLLKDEGVLVKFKNSRDKNVVFSGVKELDSDIKIFNDFSYNVRQTRKQLIPHMLAAREEGKSSKLKFDKLVIDGNIFSLEDFERD
ncbi:hypothetical protein SNE40_011920 [Patella caerulea]|uniref:Uncharacterized protein n=1 Tax=Patella caerulea TaxID=87958 RepID=A0AAN8JNR6_PATCE